MPANDVFFGATRDIVLIDGECGTVHSLAMRDKSDATVNTGHVFVPCCPVVFGLCQCGVHGVDGKHRRMTFFFGAMRDTLSSLTVNAGPCIHWQCGTNLMQPSMRDIFGVDGIDRKHRRMTRQYGTSMCLQIGCKD